MKLMVTCALRGDEGELSDWLDNQDICEVSYHNDYAEAVLEDARCTKFYIIPAERELGTCRRWGEFVTALAESGFLIW